MNLQNDEREKKLSKDYRNNSKVKYRIILNIYNVIFLDLMRWRSGIT